MCVSSTSEKDSASWETTSLQSCEVSRTFALSTEQSLFDRLRAASKPTRAMRRISLSL
jgi:hypothetical protein